MSSALLTAMLIAGPAARPDLPSASELAAAIRAGELSSVALVESQLARVDAYNPGLNAIVTLDAAGARARARQADEALARGELWGPLHGVPVTVKDSFATAGIRTTAGYSPLSAWVPDADATVVALLREAGAIVLGKTNLPTLAMDMQTTNPVFGRTNNAWDPERTAGGSSGGCSVAVATGMSALSVGSDLAGSLRVPTAFNGVYGFKPSHHLISLHGHVPPIPGEIDGMTWNMAVAGPIARTADDLALAFDVLARPHATDRTVLPTWSAEPAPPPVDSLRVAWTDTLPGVPVSREIQDVMAATVERLARAGAQVSRAAPAALDPVSIWETWGALVGAQGGYERSNLSRRLGKLFVGRQVEHLPMHRHILDPITVPSYMQSLGRQDRAAQAMDALFDAHDVWIVPVSSTTAFPHLAPSRMFGAFPVYDEPLMVDGQPVPYFVATQSWTTLFNVTGNPVVSMPVGLGSSGLPVGVQVVGRRYDDRRLLQVVRTLSRTLQSEVGGAPSGAALRRDTGAGL